MKKTALVITLFAFAAVVKLGSGCTVPQGSGNAPSHAVDSTQSVLETTPESWRGDIAQFQQKVVTVMEANSRGGEAPNILEYKKEAEGYFPTEKGEVTWEVTFNGVKQDDDGIYRILHDDRDRVFWTPGGYKVEIGIGIEPGEDQLQAFQNLSHGTKVKLHGQLSYLIATPTVQPFTSEWRGVIVCFTVRDAVLQ